MFQNLRRATAGVRTPSCGRSRSRKVAGTAGARRENRLRAEEYMRAENHRGASAGTARRLRGRRAENLQAAPFQAVRPVFRKIAEANQATRCPELRIVPEAAGGPPGLEAKGKCPAGAGFHR